MNKILVSDQLAKEGLEVLAQVKDISVDIKVGLKPAELQKIIGDYDALLVRSATKVDATLLAAAKKLKIVGRAGIGIDNVDVAAATKHGVVVMNTPEGNVITTAEHTLAMLMALTRKIPQATASMKNGKWEKKAFEGREIFNKTLGVIGLGNIGKIVADRARGMRMKVIAADPFMDAAACARLGAELVSLDELFRRSDYITVHTPLNDETRGIIGDRAFDLMKPGVFIINCARGGIVDEAALIRALDGGKVAGAAFDVFTEEPTPPAHHLVKHEKVICTPHLGASTEEAQVNVSIAVAEQVIEFLKGGVARNAVNLPRVSTQDLEVVGPYMTLVERAGSFVSQLHDQELCAIEIIYEGEIAEHNTAPLTAAVLKAVLSQQIEAVNYVNASLVAKERHIQVTEQKSLHAQDYASTITVRLRGQREVNEVCATLFGKSVPRFVRLNGMDCEVAPEGYLLVLRNKDLPGVVGFVGSILGSHGINIARMGLGRDRQSGDALQALNLDIQCSPQILEQLAHFENMISVKQVHLS